MRLESSVGRDDADSGVVCTDTTDIENDVSDHSLKHSDSLKHSEADHGTSASGSKLHQVASRRVYLNHRNITKMKDIKYKRITKTKSKSMEELRDKLRNAEFKFQFCLIKKNHMQAVAFSSTSPVITLRSILKFNLAIIRDSPFPLDKDDIGFSYA